MSLNTTLTYLLILLENGKFLKGERCSKTWSVSIVTFNQFTLKFRKILIQFHIMLFYKESVNFKMNYILRLFFFYCH